MDAQTSSTPSPTTPGGEAPEALKDGAAEAHAGQAVASGGRNLGSRAPDGQVAPDKIRGGSEAQAQTAEEKKAEAAAKRRYKLKIDGKEQETELSDDEIAVELQKARAASKRFEEAAKMRKEVEEVIKYGKENPADAFKRLFGMDLDEWSEQRLVERYNEAQLPEHERERKKLEAELNSYREREAKARKTQEAQRQEAFERQVYEQTEQEFISALDELGYDAGFSKTTLLPMMADIAEAALDHGIELSPKQMALEARKRIDAIHKKTISSLKGDRLISYLGDDIVKEVIRTKLAQTRQTPGPVIGMPKPPAEAQPEARKAPLAKDRMADFRRRHKWGLE